MTILKMNKEYIVKDEICDDNLEEYFTLFC